MSFEFLTSNGRAVPSSPEAIRCFFLDALSTGVGRGNGGAGEMSFAPN